MFGSPRPLMFAQSPAPAGYRDIWKAYPQADADFNSLNQGIGASWRQVIKPSGGFPFGGSKLLIYVSGMLNFVSLGYNIFGTIAIGKWTGTASNTVATPKTVQYIASGYYLNVAEEDVLPEVDFPFAASDGLVLIFDLASLRAQLPGDAFVCGTFDPVSVDGCRLFHKTGAATTNLAAPTGMTEVLAPNPTLTTFCRIGAK